jgi:hypothetical protein
MCGIRIGYNQRLRIWSALFQASRRKSLLSLLEILSHIEGDYLVVGATE